MKEAGTLQLFTTTIMVGSSPSDQIKITKQSKLAFQTVRRTLETSEDAAVCCSCVELVCSAQVATCNCHV